MRTRNLIMLSLLVLLTPEGFAGSLLNVSYNGPVDSTDVRLGFIVEQSATFVLTAESYPGSGGDGVPDPTLELMNVLDGTIFLFNDDCDIDIVALLDRPLATEFDACAVVQLSTGPYALIARDADGVSGNIIAALTELPAAAALLLPQTTLAWDTSIGPDVGGYRLYYGTASAAYTSQIKVGNQTHYTLTGLAPNRLYFFAVTAYHRLNDRLESGFSNEASVLISRSSPAHRRRLSYNRPLTQQ